MEDRMLVEEKKKFEQFVSLGYSCPVAASMGKYGLRSWSGVFDWLVTESSFEKVLYYMENDFTDFLIREDLELYTDNPTYFRDKKSGFYFVHDGFLLEEEFDKLQEKFHRRINRFIDETSKPTCFFRYVNSCAEVQYIMENEKYINQVIKKKNQKNEIWFLFSQEKEVAGFPFTYFKIKAPYSGKNRSELRGLFDENQDFLEKCAECIESKKLLQNLLFESNKEKRIENTIKNELVIEKRYQLAMQMHFTEWPSIALPNNLRIFGAGNIGKIFLKYIKNRCDVDSFIDSNADTYGTYIDGIRINALAKTDFSKKIPIVVTATYDFERICEDIKKYDKDAIVLSLDEVLENRAVF